MMQANRDGFDAWRIVPRMLRDVDSSKIKKALQDAFALNGFGDGGKGTVELRNFYAKHFLNQLPPDMEVISVSRTVGQGRVIDELVLKFTHTVQMDCPQDYNAQVLAFLTGLE